MERLDSQCMSFGSLSIGSRLCIMNGRHKCDNYYRENTRYKTKGCSLVDYIIASAAVAYVVTGNAFQCMVYVDCS